MSKNIMNKKIEVKIPNRVFYFLTAIILIIGVGVGVYAYNPSASGNPSVMGHSLNELAPPSGCQTGQILQRSPTTLGWNCVDLPSGSGGVTTPVTCTGSNKGLQWTGSAWSCATYVTSPGGGGSCTSVSCSWTNWGTVCGPDYRQYNMHSVPSVCSSSSSKYTATSYYCSGGYITNSQLVTCCPNSLPLD